jgi:hypothetical protein
MPNEEFLEQYPLYRKFPVQHMPDTLNALAKVRINMDCEVCASAQTFLMTNEYHENFQIINHPANGVIFRLVYLCVHCQQFERFFFVKVDYGMKWLMKVGQFPPWETVGNHDIERLLGKHAVYFKRGLTCESQSYGIAAFGYYRRIVEETIDELLEEIADLLTGEDLSKYRRALEETKKTTVAQEKISLVKDLLPPILRPSGMNPLSALHSALSEGLHAESDEACLDLAAHCREVLVFLVNQVAASKASARTFTESMKRLLEKKTKALP